MSTKTLRKRIALVAVSALGFGLVGVAPAIAADPAATTLPTIAGSASPATTTVAVGTEVTAQLGATFAAAAADADTYGVVAGLTKPLGSAVTWTANQGSTTTTDILAQGTLGSSLDTWSNNTSTNLITVDATGAFTAAAKNLGTATFTPDVPGTYVLTLSGSADAAAADAAADATWTVIALPIQASLTSTLTAVVLNPNTTTATAGTDPSIVVSRNAGGAAADGNILGIVTATADTTDQPVGQTFGRVSVAANSTAANVISGVTVTATNSTTTTFAFEDDSPTLSAGTYSFRFWVDTNVNGVYDSTEVTTTASFTISAAVSAIAGVSVSIDNATRANSDNLREFTVTATLTDASGRATTGSPAVVESGSFDATNIDASTDLIRVGTTNTYRGTFIVNAAPAAGSDFEDITLTVTSGSFANTATLRVVTLAELTGVAGVPTVSVTDVVGIGSYTDGVRQPLSVFDYTTLGLAVDKTVLAQTYTFNAAVGDEGEYLKVAVAPAADTSSAVIAPSYSLVPVGANLQAKYTATSVAPASSTVRSDSYTLTVTDGSGDDVVATITYATATPAWSVSPSASFKAKFGDTSTVTGTLSDQFGRILSGKSVYVLVTGRQAGTYNGTTAADGTFAFTWTDTNAATTVTLTDALTFNYQYFASATSTSTTPATSASRTVTYSATGVAVGSITVGAPSATATRPIDMDASVGLPAEGSRVTYTASVLDAAGLPVASGALVTFTGGADDLFYGGTTGVTNEFGQASVVVYRTKVGAPAIKATAGGVTSAASAAVQWTNDVADGDAAGVGAPNASSAKRHARYITLAADVASVVSAGIIRFTATVTDRWGNAVDGAQVTFAETGAGRFYNPPTSNQVTTNAAGEASIDLNSQAGETGAVSVTATITESTALQAINEDTAGFITNITEAGGTFSSALTAVAGVTAAVKSATATATITKDTSTSTADALLALATALGTRDQASAAVDAAAEATDAANAATDAANAAAEAADAATAAAQDAADAVAALSTQVSEMVAALKKQITSLTNLVIKIQKKVRA